MIISSIQGTEVAQPIAKAALDTQKAQAPVAEQAFYFSPALIIDPKSGTDVLEYRNSSTGAVINQYPSEKDIKAYSQHSEKQDDTTAPAQNAIVETIASTADQKTPAAAPAAAVAPPATAPAKPIISETV